MYHLYQLSTFTIDYNFDEEDRYYCLWFWSMIILEPCNKHYKCHVNYLFSRNTYEGCWHKSPREVYNMHLQQPENKSIYSIISTIAPSKSVVPWLQGTILSKNYSSSLNALSQMVQDIKSPCCSNSQIKDQTQMLWMAQHTYRMRISCVGSERKATETGTEPECTDELPPQQGGGRAGSKDKRYLFCMFCMLYIFIYSRVW